VQLFLAFPPLKFRRNLYSAGQSIIILMDGWIFSSLDVLPPVAIMLCSHSLGLAFTGCQLLEKLSVASLFHPILSFLQCYTLLLLCCGKIE